MEKDFGSWSQHQHFKKEPPNLNSLCVPSDLGQKNFVPTYWNHLGNMVSTNGASLELPLSCSQHLRHAYGPNKVVEKRPIGYTEKPEAFATNIGSGFAQKRFLVFDQSGDRTTLIFSPGTGTPFQCLTSYTPNPHGASVLNRQKPGKEEIKVDYSGPNLTDEDDVNHGDDLASEMREDTEELNALLYSDDDTDYSDEETSTGHSPSTMTAYDRQEFSEESGEEVASSAEPAKRIKMLDGGFNVPPPVKDAAISVITNRCSEYEDDASSSCADVKNQKHEVEAFDFLVGDQRLKKEKIRETVNILRSIVPGGNGDNAVVILDEAIRYLKSLKRKAEALGLQNL